mgnify:CR=1 FL=1
MNWLKKFMAGRYGTDQLSLVLLIFSILISILSVVLNSLILNIFYLIIIVIFSKNLSKRYQENMKFLRMWNSIKGKFKNKFRQIKELKDYKYFKCVNCKQKLRVPRGKGKISITCPKCKTVMIKKS